MAPPPVPEEDEETKRQNQRKAALVEKEKRRKLRDESIAARCIRDQLEPIFASFEEDAVTPVIDKMLGSQEEGVNYQSACSDHPVKPCAFCNLSDTGLGSSLVRVPTKEEWNELIPHLSRSRNVFMVANIPTEPGNDSEEEEDDDMKVDPSSQPSSKNKPAHKWVLVSVRVGDELYSSEPDEALFRGVQEGGMLEFLPRNPLGFQNEVGHRVAASLPVITGSLSGHESCAVAVHNARKDKLLQDFSEERAFLTEKDLGDICGRTLPLGRDRFGRSYWKLHGKSYLFVFEERGERMVKCYSHPAVIASLISFLGKDKIVPELIRLFPDAAELSRGRKWRETILDTPAEELGTVQDGSTTSPSEDDDEDDDEYDELEDEVSVFVRWLVGSFGVGRSGF